MKSKKVPLEKEIDQVQLDGVTYCIWQLAYPAGYNGITAQWLDSDKRTRRVDLPPNMTEEYAIRHAAGFITAVLNPSDGNWSTPLDLVKIDGMRFRIRHVDLFFETKWHANIDTGQILLNAKERMSPAKLFVELLRIAEGILFILKSEPYPNESLPPWDIAQWQADFEAAAQAIASAP